MAKCGVVECALPVALLLLLGLLRPLPGKFAHPSLPITSSLSTRSLTPREEQSSRNSLSQVQKSPTDFSGPILPLRNSRARAAAVPCRAPCRPEGSVSQSVTPPRSRKAHCHSTPQLFWALIGLLVRARAGTRVPRRRRSVGRCACPSKSCLHKRAPGVFRTPASGRRRAGEREQRARRPPRPPRRRRRNAAV